MLKQWKTLYPGMQRQLQFQVEHDLHKVIDHGHLDSQVVDDEIKFTS